MQKITKKVKRKRVTCKKKAVKKTARKKIKKKAVKKKVKKTVKKKVTKKKKTSKAKVSKSSKKKKKVVKRKRKRKITMDDIYKIVNRVQIDKKKVIFAMYQEESEVAENVIVDVGLKYNKIIMKTQVVFTIYPKRGEDELDILDVVYLDDEIPEDGQIFG